MGCLEGKVAFVSGGGCDLAAPNARILASEGAKVVIADAHEEEGKKIAKSLGSQGRFLYLDVIDPSEWIDTVETTEKVFGRINILVNHARRVNYSRFDDYSNQQFGECIEVNLFGTFYGMKTVIPSMQIAGGGSIINVSSVSGLKVLPRQPGYVASSWGVRGLTKSAALDLAQYNIRVNSIHAGDAVTTETGADSIETTPGSMNRRYSPEEIARLVLFLASDKSIHITGAEIPGDDKETTGWINRG